MALRDWPIGGPMASQDIPYRFDTLIAEGFGLRNLSKASIFSAMDGVQAEAAAAAKAAARGVEGGHVPWHAPLLLNDSSIIFQRTPLAPPSKGGVGSPQAIQLFLPASAPSVGAEAAQMAAGGSTGTGGPTAQQWAAVKPHLARPFQLHSEERLREWSVAGQLTPPDAPVTPLLHAGGAKAQSMMTAPHVATLMGLLPRAYTSLHCAVLFSTARHSSTLETLYKHTAGVAPVLLLIQFSIDIPRMSADDPPALAEGGSEVAAGAGLGGGRTAQRATTHTSTVALFSEGGLAAPNQGGIKAGVWNGTRNDFLLQLQPDIMHFTAARASELTILSETGSAGTLHRQPFQIERMTACTSDMLLVGGSQAGLPPALSISADFNSASASSLLLEDLCIPVNATPGGVAGGAVSEAAVRIGAVEAFGFVDAFGGLQSPPAQANPRAAKLAQGALAAATAADEAFAEIMRE